MEILAIIAAIILIYNIFAYYYNQGVGVYNMIVNAVNAARGHVETVWIFFFGLVLETIVFILINKDQDDAKSGLLILSVIFLVVQWAIWIIVSLIGFCRRENRRQAKAFKEYQNKIDRYLKRGWGINSKGRRVFYMR